MASPRGEFVYLDNAATTPLCAEAAEAVARGLLLFGNPSSRHPVGEAAAEALVHARNQVAALFGCPPDEVVFTGGGSEADTLAVVGTILAARNHRRSVHLVTTAIEHSAVLESAAWVRETGAEVTIIAPDASGTVQPAAVRGAMRPDTVLVSVMHANNETGVVQPVDEIAAVARDGGALMHIDAVQTAGKLDLAGLDADLISVSAHKFHGPKGVGALRVAPDVQLSPLLRGGGQEAGRRAGTENIPGILGMGAAAALAIAHLSERDEHGALRQLLLERLSDLDGVRVNGEGTVMAETVNLSFAGVRGDTVVDVMAAQGVCLSAGSACHAGKTSPSHVLAAMGLPTEWARGAVRVSFSRCNTADEVVHAADLLIATVRRLRDLTPLVPAQADVTSRSLPGAVTPTHSTTRMGSTA